jgi:hypothetical protein
VPLLPGPWPQVFACPGGTAVQAANDNSAAKIIISVNKFFIASPYFKIKTYATISCKNSL